MADQHGSTSGAHRAGVDEHAHSGHDDHDHDHDDHDDHRHAPVERAHVEHSHDQHSHDQHDHGEHSHDVEHGDHGHGHDHGDHGHEHPGGLKGFVLGLVKPHSHDSADKVDTALETSALGIRAVWVSFLGLLATAVLQAVVYGISGSVALLGDTLHNLADALTAVPLALAFVVGRRAPDRRYTYGYGRAEDLAGIVVVALITISAVAAAWESARRLAHPQPLDHAALVAVAAVIGFVGNESVARYRIAVGRRIGSAALVADGLHARTDGFTSLAVLIAAGGAAIGWDWVDPVIGLVITFAILFVLRDAAREVYRRLMDAVDPELVDQVEAVLRRTEGVLELGDVRVRWIGHALRAECEIVVDAALSVGQAHDVAEHARHNLLHDVPRLTTAMVHADPWDPDGEHHAALAHHDPRPPAAH